MSDSEQLWRSIADLASMLLSEETEETTLRRVADLAVRTIPTCDAVGVTLQEGDKVSTRAATGGLVYEVDNHQYEVGEGPCLTAMCDRTVTAVTDMATEQRWPKFCRHAAERGILSSISFPLIVRGDSLGALNLYARRRSAFSAGDHVTGAMFAAQAAVALTNAQTYATSATLARQLNQALDSRAVIDQAIGILIGLHGYDQEAALASLRLTSQASNRRVRDIAQEIVDGAINRRETGHQEGSAADGETP